MTFKDLTYQAVNGEYFIDDIGFDGIQFKGYVLLKPIFDNCAGCMFRNVASMDCLDICSSTTRPDKKNVIIVKLKSSDNDNDFHMKNCSICKHYNSNGECDASMKPLLNCIAKEFVLFKDFNEDN